MKDPKSVSEVPLKLQENRNAMQKLKTLPTLRLTMLMVGAVLAVGFIGPMVAMAQDNSDEANDPGAHAQHVDQQPAGDENLAVQLAELHAKVARLEAALAKLTPPAGGTGDSDSTHAGGKGVKAGDKDVDQGARVAAKFQNCTECHQTRPSGPLPPSHLDMTASATTPPPSGRGKSAEPDRGDGKMKEKGMGMKGKAKGMGMNGMMGQGGQGMGGGMGKGMMGKGGQGMGKGMTGQGGQGMGNMGGGEAETGGSASGTMEQQMQTLQMKVMEMQMKMMEMQMKMMEMKE